MNKQTPEKHVKISFERHRLLKILSAKTGKQMKEIMNDAFDFYVDTFHSVERDQNK